MANTNGVNVVSATEQMTNDVEKQSKHTPKIMPIGDCSSVEEFTKRGLANIVEATKAVNAFPQGATRDLYCAYPSFGRVVDEQSERVLGLISKVLKWQNIKGNIQRRQQDEQFEMILECNDAILERLNINLDQLAGLKKNQKAVVVESHVNMSDSPGTAGAGSWNLNQSDASPVAARLLTAKNIQRPQIKFKVPVDNTLTPFVPKIKDKPNSLKPLAILPEYDDNGMVVSYLHPYEFELMKWNVPAEQLKRKSPELPPNVETTELVYVDTIDKLTNAVDELRRCKEVAIDVEHHSYRTFQGFTCLVQISTRFKDYIFDALELRDEMHLLNEILTDPKVVKILHGAEKDVEWLQRDLSLYIVNMFDTHQAAKTLNFARLSLSYLLKHYCDIDADKTFQLADWRMRPLPVELIKYARQDTHFLIYIFERLTNDLLDAGQKNANLLRTTYQLSTELCKKRYLKPTISVDSHMDMYRKSKRIFDNRQLFALCELFRWRDIMARQEDESYGYVMPNHMMLQIAESLPREMQGILACCNPIPPLVRQNLHALHHIVLRAREQPLVKKILEAGTSHRFADASVKDYNSKLHCPHDLTQSEEFRDDLPTLISFRKLPSSKTTQQETLMQIKMPKPVLTIYDRPERSDENDKNRRPELLTNAKFVSPYQRYLAVLPLVEKENLEEAARIEAENKKKQLCPAANLQPVKEEPDGEEKGEADDSYSLPIKELLKRKYEESREAKRQNVVENISAKLHDTTNEPKAKRLKVGAPSGDKLNFLNTPTQSNKNKHQTQSSPSQIITPAQSNSKETNAQESDSGPEELPSTSQTPETNVQYQKCQKQNPKKQQFKKMKNKSKSHQSSNVSVQPPSFDYKNIDFKKFQGGAQRAKGAEIRPQFHAKSNSSKANNKKFNKLFTFSNAKA